MVVIWAGYRHVRLHVFKICFLQSTVWPDVEGVGFAEQGFQPQLGEIDVDALPHAFGANAALSVRWLKYMKMHVRSFAVHNLVTGREPDRLTILEPKHEKRPA